MNARHLLLFVAPTVLFLIDLSLTLTGQLPDYWAGDYQLVRELSPEANRVLSYGPWAIGPAVLLWLSMVAGLLVLLPRFWALAFSAAVTIGHCVGATSWIVWRHAYGYQLSMALCVVTGILLAGTTMACYRFILEGPPPKQLTPWLRWTLVLILLAISAYLFLIPHQVPTQQTEVGRVIDKPLELFRTYS